MKRLSEIAIKAFNEGSDNFGEVPTGVVNNLLKEVYNENAIYLGSPSAKTHDSYSVCVMLKDSQGRDCTSGVGFYVKNDKIEVCSGHIVFTVDMTPEIQAELNQAEVINF